MNDIFIGRVHVRGAGGSIGGAETLVDPGGGEGERRNGIVWGLVCARYVVYVIRKRVKKEMLTDYPFSNNPKPMFGGAAEL